MRILGFSKKWDKLKQDEFTTFRFQRKDKDWYVCEDVQIVYKPRSKNREILGEAFIINKEKRWCFNCILGNEGIESVTNYESKEDGFNDCYDMEQWLTAAYGERIYKEPMNKLTLRWVQHGD